MTTSEKCLPKHRAPGSHRRRREPLAGLRRSVRSAAARPRLAIGGLAVAVTGIAVLGGVGTGGGGTGGGVSAPTAVTTKSPSAGVAALAAARVADRGEPVSRSDRRGVQDAQKAAALSAGPGVVTTHERTLSNEDPRDVARALLGDFGFADSQFSCLDRLWAKESGWQVDADNPRSSAYGIPQALPGSKMASAGVDWVTNPVTQITWGLGYIKSRYGNPCSAWSHSQNTGWY